NVISTVGTLRARPAFTAWAISSAWPRCTPSNTPMVSTHLPQSVGISSWPRHRCTPASLRRRAVHGVPDRARLGVDCLNFLVVRADDEPGGITPVGQDYLKVIWNAQEWSVDGGPAKVSTKMLAARIGVSASTASESIRKLAEQGLVDHEKYGAVTLTEAGRRAAPEGGRRHRRLGAFLGNEPGDGWDEVDDEAEVLEHAVSDRLVARIDAKLGFPRRDPHGDPIPASDLQVPTPPARQLWACGDGETGTVARISDADPEML